MSLPQAVGGNINHVGIEPAGLLAVLGLWLPQGYAEAVLDSLCTRAMLWRYCARQSVNSRDASSTATSFRNREDCSAAKTAAMMWRA